MPGNITTTVTQTRNSYGTTTTAHRDAIPDHMPSVTPTLSDAELAFAAGATSLTPEVILGITRRRLADMDRQIESGLNLLELRSEQSLELNRQQGALDAILTTVNAAEGDDMTIDELREANFTIGGTTYTGAELLDQAGLGDRFRGHLANSTHAYSASEVEDMLEQVKREAKDLNSNNEMLMLNVQTLTQQRAQIITIATQMVNKFHEGDLAIARNL